MTNSRAVNTAVTGVVMRASPMITLVTSWSMKMSKIAKNIWNIIMF